MFALLAYVVGHLALVGFMGLDAYIPPWLWRNRVSHFREAMSVPQNRIYQNCCRLFDVFTSQP